MGTHPPDAARQGFQSKGRQEEAHRIEHGKGDAGDEAYLVVLCFAEHSRRFEAHDHLLDVGESINEHCLHPQPGEGVSQAYLQEGGPVGTITRHFRIAPLLRASQAARLLDDQGRDDGKQKYQRCPEIDEDIVADESPNEVGQHAKKAGDRLHPGIALGAYLPVRRHIGDDRPRRVEGDVDGQIQGERYGDRHSHQAVEPHRVVDDVNIRHG